VRFLALVRRTRRTDASTTHRAPRECPTARVSELVVPVGGGFSADPGAVQAWVSNLAVGIRRSYDRMQPSPRRGEGAQMVSEEKIGVIDALVAEAGRS